MRALMYFAVVVAASSVVAAHAQTHGAHVAEPAVDFSGFYIGARRPFIEPNAYPLTAEGQRAHDAYDPLVGDPRQYDDCAEESFPAVLSAAVSNMQITQEDAGIELRYERGGEIRSIHMDGEPPPADQPHSGLGYSIGHWVGDVLTIETTHLESGVVFTTLGYPLSRETRITERYSRDAENDLHMELVIEDPVNYTEPVTLEREWIWSPDHQIILSDCVSLGDRDGEPDFDELRRILNQR